ncbi:glycosyltransferase [bacterium]|nr:glycosyltransferase [candidate division CSSED10-310 bacterium]
MSSRETVSVIIPCYNEAAYIERAIRSALVQTYPYREIVVIDDGSTDNSLEIIKRFDGEIIWHSGPNRGGSAARNEGIRQSHGNFIQFLDADDLLHPNKIERQIEIASQVKEDIVFCDYDRILVNGSRRSGSYLGPYGGGDIIPFMLRHQMQTSAPLHRRHWIEKIGGFNESLPCAQEYDLNIRLACAGATFYHLQEILFSLQRRSQSVSSNFQKVLDQYRVILQNAFEILRENGNLTESRSRAFAETMASAARHYIREKATDKAKSYFEIAREMHPSGGLKAFSWPYRMGYYLVGPMFTEMLVDIKRYFRCKRKRNG